MVAMLCAASGGVSRSGSLVAACLLSGLLAVACAADDSACRAPTAATATAARPAAISRLALCRAHSLLLES